MTPTADESVKFLTTKLKNREPFVFTKFGDGDLWWMAEKPVLIAGGETYRPGIGQELREAAVTLEKLPHAWFGDQLTCGSGPYLEVEQAMFVQTSRWLHFECLLIHRLSPELLEFYRTLKYYRRNIAWCGGKHLLTSANRENGSASVFELFGMPEDRHVGYFLGTEIDTAHTNWLNYADKLSGSDPTGYHGWDVLLLSAGRASKLIAAKLATQFPERTIIELGSALDPLFVGRTRSEQIDPEKAREYFKELL